MDEWQPLAARRWADVGGAACASAFEKARLHRRVRCELQVQLALNSRVVRRGDENRAASSRPWRSAHRRGTGAEAQTRQ
eukprot:6198769-Pleurochrysis_carterae.AAC.4